VGGRGVILKKNLKRIIIVRLQFSSNGDIYFGNACPCVHCLEVLKDSHIKKIFYTVDNDSDDYDYLVPLEIHHNGIMHITVLVKLYNSIQS
jgi:deoxycytidylate deaminase